MAEGGAGERSSHELQHQTRGQLGHGHERSSPSPSFESHPSRSFEDRSTETEEQQQTKHYSNREKVRVLLGSCLLQLPIWGALDANVNLAVLSIVFPFDADLMGSYQLAAVFDTACFFKSGQTDYRSQLRLRSHRAPAM
jgi:hypothetical protein